MQNLYSTITVGHCNKSKSEVDPDTNSAPKVDLKKNSAPDILTRAGDHMKGFPPPPPFPCKQTDSETKRHSG